MSLLFIFNICIYTKITENDYNYNSINNIVLFTFIYLKYYFYIIALKAVSVCNSKGCGEQGRDRALPISWHAAPDFNELLREQHFLLDVPCEE